MFLYSSPTKKVNAGIHDQDIIVVSQGQPINEGDIVVARVDSASRCLNSQRDRQDFAKFIDHEPGTGLVGHYRLPIDRNGFVFRIASPEHVDQQSSKAASRLVLLVVKREFIAATEGGEQEVGVSNGRAMMSP